MDEELDLLMALCNAYEGMTGSDPEPWMGDWDREVCGVIIREEEND